METEQIPGSAVIDTTLAKSRADALIRITQAIETAATLDELLMLALNELAQLFLASHGSVMLLNEECSEGRIVCELPSSPVPTPVFAIDDVALLRHAISQRQLVLIGDVGRQNRDELSAFLAARQVHSALVAPLISQDQTIGLLMLGNTERGQRFSADDSALARVLAGQVAAAIVAFRTTEEAQRRNAELSTLNEIASAVTSTLDPHEIYALVVQKLNQYFMVDAGSILLTDELTGNMRFVMTIEGGEEKLAGITVPVGQGVVGHVAETGQWEIVPDVQHDPRFYREVSEAVGYVTRSILCVPLVAKGRVIGAIELLNKLNGDFTRDDAERLTRMAAFIGVAIENARLFQQVTDAYDRLEAILNSTADGILMADDQGAVLSANPTAGRLLEADERVLLGRSLGQLLDALQSRAHDVVTRTWGDSADPDVPVLTITEYELGGARRHFVRHMTLPVRDKTGDVYGHLALFRDITQEKELEQLREDYTGMLVHDLRAPLTSIMNGIMMVQRGLGGPVTEQQRELLSMAHQGSQTMLELINNLLDISKMEQGRKSLDLEPLSPYALADEATERLRALARSRQVAIEQQLDVGLPTIEADRDKIVRVLQNLLDNALKFSPVDGLVTLGAQLRSGLATPGEPALAGGDWLVFWIRDRGPGIPAAYHERIFEKFGQVRGRKVRGTGLGLTFCKLAVEAHNGYIWLESEEGAGSTFAFGLPLATT